MRSRNKDGERDKIEVCCKTPKQDLTVTYIIPVIYLIV